MTPSRSPSAPKPVKAFAILDERGKTISVQLKRKDAWRVAHCFIAESECSWGDFDLYWDVLAMKEIGFRCIRVTITPA